MNREKQRQARVLTQFIAGRLSTAEAALALNRSTRWIEAMRPQFREKGLVVLVHGNTGRQPANTLPGDDRARVLEFAKGKYKSFNLTQLWEMLTEVEGMAISKRSVHRICTSGGVPSPKARKRRVLHRKRRQRARREGDMVQMDGSPHDWLEGRGPRMTLITAVDDATGFKWAVFREGEDLEGYMSLFRQIVETRGIPGCVYTDGLVRTGERGRSLVREAADKVGQSLVEGDPVGGAAHALGDPDTPPPIPRFMSSTPGTSMQDRPVGRRASAP